MSFNLVTNLRGYFTPKTSLATMEKYTSVPTSDNSSAEALLNKGARNSLDTDSVEDFSSHHKPRSWYRRNERTLITGIVVFLANMTICVVYTHWLTSQYSHFKPTYPWCMSPGLSNIPNCLTAYSSGSRSCQIRAARMGSGPSPPTQRYHKPRKTRPFRRTTNTRTRRRVEESPPAPELPPPEGRIRPLRRRPQSRPARRRIRLHGHRSRIPRPTLHKAAPPLPLRSRLLPRHVSRRQAALDVPRRYLYPHFAQPTYSPKLRTLHRLAQAIHPMQRRHNHNPLLLGRQPRLPPCVRQGKAHLRGLGAAGALGG